MNPRDGTEVWSYSLGKHTLTTAAVHDGLVYATDADGGVHCVDEKTGAGIWTHTMNGTFWASPMVAALGRWATMPQPVDGMTA